MTVWGVLQGCVACMLRKNSTKCKSFLCGISPRLSADAKEEPPGDGKEIDIAERDLRLGKRLQAAEAEGGSADEVDAELRIAIVHGADLDRHPVEADAGPGVGRKGLIACAELVQGIKAELEKTGIDIRTTQKGVIDEIPVERPVEQHRQPRYRKAGIGSDEKLLNIARNV